MEFETLPTVSGEPCQGPLLFKPMVFTDERGFFFESWNQTRFQAALMDSGLCSVDAKAVCFVQDNHSASRRGVLRGLHYQMPSHPQGKLVRCTSGAIFDVAVDLRRHSSTYGSWVAAELSSENHLQLWVPEGFAHGFLSLTDHVEVLYKASGFWNRDSERSLLWNDPTLSIEWPLLRACVDHPMLAGKDSEAPHLEQLELADEVFA